MAVSVRLLLLCSCATVSTSDFQARWPAFYETVRARLDREFHGVEVARRTQLGAGRWSLLVRIDLDPTGDNQGCALLRSSGFNALDEEGLAACRRVKDMLFPPEESIEADRRVHVPVQLGVEN